MKLLNMIISRPDPLSKTLYMVADDAKANPSDQTDSQETRTTSSGPQRCPCQADCAPPEKNGVTETGCSAGT